MILVTLINMFPKNLNRFLSNSSDFFNYPNFSCDIVKVFSDSCYVKKFLKESCDNIIMYPKNHIKFLSNSIVATLKITTGNIKICCCTFYFYIKVHF